MNANVSLGLAKLPIPKKIEKSRQIVKAMSASPIFASALPTLASVTSLTDEVESAYTDAKNGGPAQTAVLYTKVAKLDNALTQLGNFVENLADGDEAIILAAGMGVKGKASRQANTFTVTDGDHEGEAFLLAPVTKRASYVWQRSVDPLPTEPPEPANSSKWQQVAVTTVANLTTDGLIPGTKYWFRVATVTSSGQGLWSDPISLRPQ